MSKLPQRLTYCITKVAGSTGWMSSVSNMACGIASSLGTQFASPGPLGWEDRKLAWAVREPFASKHSSAKLIVGNLQETDELVC